MKKAETHKMNNEELEVEVARLRRHLYDLRCQQVTERIEDTTQFGKTKKDVARLLTELRMRRSGAEKEKAQA
ncbi:MAG: 50S ribosomal protein L29 [Phycisphaerales bacterium]|nr:50S ribosomal protein L29 [Phycisphaerales bacterium]